MALLIASLALYINRQPLHPAASGASAQLGPQAQAGRGARSAIAHRAPAKRSVSSSGGQPKQAKHLDTAHTSSSSPPPSSASSSDSQPKPATGSTGAVDRKPEQQSHAQTPSYTPLHEHRTVSPSVEGEYSKVSTSGVEGGAKAGSGSGGLEGSGS
jgi:hypothetical protein